MYMYLRSKDHTPYYVGKGRGRRAVQPHGYAKRPKNKKQIVFAGEGLSEVDAFQAEILLIHLYGRKDLGTGILRNLSAGGEGQSGYSDETRWKMGRGNRGRRGGTSWNKGLPGTWTGRHHTEETKAVLSQKRTGMKNPKSPEARAKLSATNKGKRPSNACIAAVIESNKRRGELYRCQKEALSAS